MVENILPDPKNVIKATPIVREMKDTRAKLLSFILLMPATIQSKSSGKSGKRNIKNNTIPPLRCNMSRYLSASDSLSIHFSTFLPSVRPIIKAMIEPVKMPVVHIKNAVAGPKSILPAKIVIMAGNGITNTCNNAILKYTNIPALPELATKSFSLSISLILSIIPVIFNTKNTR